MLFQAQQYCNAFDRTVRILIHPPSLKCCSSVTAPLRGMLPRRASPEPKIDATNVAVFMERVLRLIRSSLPAAKQAETASARHLDFGFLSSFVIRASSLANASVPIPEFHC